MVTITYDDVLMAFESSFVDKYPLPDELTYVWFERSLGDFELNIEKLEYDYVTKTIALNEDQSRIIVMNTLAELMHLYYQKREYSRVNKINNIIGKDVSLNNTDSTKKNTKEEYDSIKNIVEDYYSKQKITAYS